MGKTVKVRIAVAVDDDGEWAAIGCAGDSPDYSAIEASKILGTRRFSRVFIVEAEVPLTEPVTVHGSVAARAGEASDA